MSELSERLKQYPEIKMTGVHVDLVWDGEYPRDKWSCTITDTERNKSETFEFSEWSRVLAPGWKVDGHNKWHHTTSGRIVNGEAAAISSGILMLKKHKVGKQIMIAGPDMADVISCLLSDASACEQSYASWCEDMGVDSDSILRLNTYLECQKNGDKLSRVLGSLVSELRGLSH